MDVFAWDGNMIVVTTPSDIAERRNKNPFPEVPNRVAMPTTAVSPRWIIAIARYPFI